MEGEFVLKSVSDLGFTFAEATMFLQEGEIDTLRAKEFVADGVGDSEVGLRAKEDRAIGSDAGAGAAGCEVDDQGARVGTFSFEDA